MSMVRATLLASVEIDAKSCGETDDECNKQSRETQPDAASRIETFVRIPYSEKEVVHITNIPRTDLLITITGFMHSTPHRFHE